MLLIEIRPSNTEDTIDDYNKFINQNMPAIGNLALEPSKGQLPRTEPEKLFTERPLSVTAITDCN